MSDLQIAAPFLRWLYDSQAGYMEIVAGRPFPSKPDKIELVMSTRRWFYYDPERPDLIDTAARYIALLSESHGNVYTGVRLYLKAAKLQNSRSEEVAKPSRVIFIDDAPASPELPYSLCVRTSEGSRHAYYKCDRRSPKTTCDAPRPRWAAIPRAST